MMRKKSVVLYIWLIFLVTALALPLLAQGTKVKVVVENASLRLKPSLDSEAIEESIPLNTVLTSENKIGEWYEVKYESQVGVTLIGYIHEMYVEVLVEEAAQPPVQEAERPRLRETRQPGPLLPAEYGQKKMEIFLGGGLGFGSFLSSQSEYSYSWNYGWIAVDEGGTIQHKAKNPLGPALSFSYFFMDSLGVRLRIDPGFNQKFTDGQSNYRADYVWGWGSDFDELTWDVTGDFFVTPLSLDLVYRFPVGSFTPYISAGVSYFISKFKAKTNIGWANCWFIDAWTEAYDYLILPVSIDKPLNGAGFNFGAGFDFRIGPNLAFAIDATYFLGKSMEAKWYMPPGRYYYTGWTHAYTDFDQHDSDLFADDLDPVKIKTSFFKILIGIKMLL
jgi:outer membrane protein W